MYTVYVYDTDMGESHLLVHHKAWYGRPKHPTTTPKRWGTRGAQEGHKKDTRITQEGTEATYHTFQNTDRVLFDLKITK